MQGQIYYQNGGEKNAQEQKCEKCVAGGEYALWPKCEQDRKLQTSSPQKQQGDLRQQGMCRYFCRSFHNQSF